ncbi:MAG: ABC transporter ATP-binding protein [Thiohalomonadales bacterium]
MHGTSALVIKDLNKTYKTSIQALKGISLEVNQGDFFALLGPNGAGKSTAIGIISSLVNKTSGQISIFDFDIDTEREAAKSCIGLVPQEFNFNQFEIVEEILINQAGYYGISRRDAIKNTEYYLKKLVLWDKRKAMARDLSGGMKRRLMIARALVHEPKLLILDEPTAGVDLEIRRSMWGFLREMNSNGTTIILTTHYLEEAEQLCKNIAIIDQGEIIENTAMKELLATLNKETFVLNVNKSLNSAPDIKNYETRFIDETTLEVDVAKEQTINDLFTELSKQDIKITSLRSKSNRLEELFINLVKNK